MNQRRQYTHQLTALLEKYLLEERRNHILGAYQEARRVEDSLEFSNDIQSLRTRFCV